MVRIVYETVVGRRYEGEVVEADNGTVVLRLDDGTLRACSIECAELVGPEEDNG